MKYREEEKDMHLLSIKAMSRLNTIIKYFNLDLRYAGRRLFGACPVHNGDNLSAFNINICKDDIYYGNWFCNTHKCHQIYGNTIVGLVYGMFAKSGKSYNDAISFLKKLTSDVSIEKQTFVDDAVINFFANQTKKNNPILSKASIMSRLSTPPKFYLDKGFSESILKEFAVGVCDNPSKPMYGRAVFPIFDEKDEYMIGAVGRAIDNRSPKWLYSKGFCSSSYLFNYGKALPKIKESESVVLVEGQADVLRLYQGGILNVCGIFGSNLSEAQEFLLEKSGALNLYLAFDNDAAGQACTQKVIKNLGNIFNIKVLEYPTKDPGELSKEQIQELKKQL